MSAAAPARATPGSAGSIAVLAAIAAVRFLVPALGDSPTGLMSLVLLPAALTHAALVLPTRSLVARETAWIGWVPYGAAVVPAAIGARVAWARPEAASILTAVALLAAAIAAIALGIRAWIPATRARRSGARGLARAALLGAAAALVGVACEPFRPRLTGGLLLVLPASILTARLANRRPDRAPQPSPSGGSLTLEQIARGMAHAMRKPIDAIATDVQEVLDRTTEATERERLEGSLRLLAQLQRMVGDLLDLARGRAGASPRRIGAEKLVRQAVDEVRLRFPRGSIDVDCPDVYLRGDEAALRRALCNLIENALEAGGPASWVGIRVERSDETVRFAVADRSGGIPAEVSRRLFEPFVTTKPTGTGLGLSTAREVVHGHGGSVDVEDVPGGTRVVLRIPAARDRS